MKPNLCCLHCPCNLYSYYHGDFNKEILFLLLTKLCLHFLKFPSFHITIYSYVENMCKVVLLILCI